MMLFTHFQQQKGSTDSIINDKLFSITTKKIFFLPHLELQPSVPLGKFVQVFTITIKVTRPLEQCRYVQDCVHVNIADTVPAKKHN